jgi:hypothetical protein
MNKQGMTFDSALELCQKKRPGVEPIPAFVDQLRCYEIQCREVGLIPSCSTDGGGAEGQDETSEKDGSRKRKTSKSSSIGPSLPPSSKRRVIGPGLPDTKNNDDNDNATTREESLEKIDGNGSTSAVVKSASSTKRQASIGPSLPPGFLRH